MTERIENSNKTEAVLMHRGVVVKLRCQKDCIDIGTYVSDGKIKLDNTPEGNRLNVAFKNVPPSQLFYNCLILEDGPYISFLIFHHEKTDIDVHRANIIEWLKVHFIKNGKIETFPASRSIVTLS